MSCRLQFPAVFPIFPQVGTVLQEGDLLYSGTTFLVFIVAIQADEGPLHACYWFAINYVYCEFIADYVGPTKKLLRRHRACMGDINLGDFNALTLKPAPRMHLISTGCGYTGIRGVPLFTHAVALYRQPCVEQPHSWTSWSRERLADSRGGIPNLFIGFC